MAKTACKKCDPHEICEECPEWIFTLADLIMCMMGLFVILWVLKPGQDAQPGQPGSEELTQMLAEIREAFGHIPDPDTTDPVDLQILANKISRMKMNGPGEKGKSRQESKGAEGTETDVTSIRPGKQSAVGGRMLFDRANAQLTRETVSALDQVAREIRGHRNIVQIKGHTSLDDLPETATAEQKMDLSIRRAQAISDYLTSKGVSPDVLRVQGCSIYEPVQQRAYDPNKQASNRRVEVEVTTTLVEDFQDKPKTSTSIPAGPAASGH